MRLRFALPIACALLAACHKPPQPQPDIRPVRTVVAAAATLDAANTYAGEVRPRYESDLGFRVQGKILRREVNAGDTVKRGQVLAQLDPVDLALTEDAARAQLAALEAQLAVAKTDYVRNQKLYAVGVVGQAGLDRYTATYKAALAQVAAARAQMRSTNNQTGYAQLRADADGTVTAIMAEAGQVVTVGQPVVRLAHAGEIEVAFSLPEDQIGRVRAGMPVQVSLWVAPGAPVAGVIREVAASADPSTRTYAARVSIPQPPEALRLGMTASVRVPLAGAPALIHLPLDSLVEQQGHQGVWIYDRAAQAVAFRAVQVVGVDGNELLVGGGLAADDVVVTAGAALLTQGQKVKLLPPEPMSAS